MQGKAKLQIPKVRVEKLRWQCDSSRMAFVTTDELEASTEIVGQKRGLEALRMGLEIEGEGYEIFVSGAAGTGRSTAIQMCLEEIKDNRNPPEDICYVNNFKGPDNPKVVYLPPGQGRIFSKEMDRLIESLREKVPQVFESEVYQDRRKTIVEGIRQHEKTVYKEFEKQIQQEGYAVVAIPMGQVSRTEILPVIDDKPISWDQLEGLVDAGEFSAQRFEQMRSRYDELFKEMNERIKRVRDLEKELIEKIEKINKEMVGPVIEEAIGAISSRFKQDRVLEYLGEAEKYFMENLEIFRPKPEGQQQGIPFALVQDGGDPFRQFKVNLLVDNSDSEGAPVIFEAYPSYRNLFGTIERVLDPRGSSRTDFTKIKAGSFLRANGGYLIIDAKDALMEQGVWQALKRSLKQGAVEIQTVDPFMFFGSSTLKPEPIKTNVKVIMLGDTEIYYTLYHLDDDFKKVFKIKADFDTVMENAGEAVEQYARFVRKITQEEDLPAWHRDAIVALVEEGVRQAGKKGKISTRFHFVADVIREAAYRARKEDSDLVQASHVESALENRHWRFNLVEEKMREMIEDGTVFIDTDGTKVGQINGLSIYDLGEISFGRPSRITAQTSMGKTGVMNIERESQLGGPIHNKGVYILGGYLRGKYTQDKPLSMSASICFEQSYTGVDGDSASSAELYAILSSLTGIPIRQDIAVTGSVNQKGEIQPIGGVNQKIEGFFEICRLRGLTGNQGVMIPESNVDDLMLRKDVVEAVAEGKFSVIPVQTIDEGIQILTGVPSGERGPDGRFQEGTFNFLVDRRLGELAQGLKNFGTSEGPG